MSQPEYSVPTGHLLTNYQGDGVLLPPNGQYIATLNNVYDPQTHTFLQTIVRVLRIP